jgi:hypothetical protein
VTGIEAVPARFAEFAKDPALYVARFHGIARDQLWSKQIEIMESVRDHKYTAVPAGHNLSKTFTASLVAWWWKMCHRPSKVIVTAPGNRQAGLVIGNEIRARHDQLARRWSGPGEMAMFGIENPPNTEGWRQDAENFMAWFATTPDRASEHATRMAGFHSPNLLFVFEEAAAIPKVIWESVQGSMLASHARLLAIGNPSDPTSQFARFCRNPDVNVIRLDAEEFPNVVEDRVIFPWGPTRAGIEELRRYWGGSSGAFQWKVRGQFPTVALDTLIGYEEVQTALERAPRPCEHAPEWIGMGCDVARFGDDLTVVFAVCRCGAILAVEERQGQDTMATAGLVLAVAQRLRLYAGVAHRIAVDDTGVGGGVTDRLREQGWCARAENFGAKARDEETFANRRAEMWWGLRDWVRATAALSDWGDAARRDRLVDDLTTPKYSHRSDSRVLLEPKADIKKRIGRSPDYGDALALAVASQTRVSRWPLVAPRPHLTPDDEEDDRDDELNATRRRMSRKWGPLGERLADFNVGGRTDGGGWTSVGEKFDFQEFKRGLRRL